MPSRFSPLEPAKPARIGLGCAIPFGLLFTIIGLFAFWQVTLRPVLWSIASSRWVETPCEIVASELESHSDSDSSTTYRVAIRYRYEWPRPDQAVEGDSGPAGEAASPIVRSPRYESDRYDFSGGPTNVGVDRMRAAVAGHPPGRHTVCYVDPADPASAVLVRRVSGAVWFGAIALLFPAFGLVFIFAVWRGGRKDKARGAMHSPLGAATAGSTTAPDARDWIEAGETLLKPAAGRVVAFIGITVFALFWNGILGIFVTQAVRNFGDGFFGWFLPVFLLPFVAVGLVVIVVALQAFSRLFAPTVEVRLDPSLLRLGARVPFAWRLGGRGVRKLTIRLIAREEATYRQGTSTSTDKADFFRAVVFESADLLSLPEGRAEITLPAGSAAPAFAAPNNKLVWELVFAGEIPWRADIDDRFVLSVRGPEFATPVTAPPEPRAYEGAGLTLWTVARFAPGETLVFTLARAASAPAGPLTVQLGWFTEGRGTRDAGIAWSEYLAGLRPGTDRSFEVGLPGVPWSFAGQLVSVAWLLEVLDAKRRPLVTVPLVVAPGGVAVGLPALPKESFRRHWKSLGGIFR